MGRGGLPVRLPRFSGRGRFILSALYNGDEGPQAWEDFVDTQLEEINRIERTALGGDNAPPASPALTGLPDCGDPPDDDFDIGGSGGGDGRGAGGSMLEYDMDDFAEEFEDELGNTARGGMSSFGAFDDDDDDSDDDDSDDDDSDDDSDDDEPSAALKAR